jgi:ligand-binding sensor domain-containing protein
MDGTGQVWVATQGAGIVRMNTDGTWVQFNTDNSGLPDNETRSVAAGAMGDIWVGTTYGGMARYNATVGVPVSDLDTRIRVFPNPTTDHVSLVLDEPASQFEWSLLSMDGRSVLAGVVAGSRSRVDLHELPSGSYLMKVNTDSSTYLIKVIVH